MQAQHECIATKPAQLQGHVVPYQAGCCRETDPINCVCDTRGDLIDRLIRWGKAVQQLLFSRGRGRGQGATQFMAQLFQSASGSLEALGKMAGVEFTQEGQESWSLRAEGSRPKCRPELQMQTDYRAVSWVLTLGSATHAESRSCPSSMLSRNILTGVFRRMPVRWF